MNTKILKTSNIIFYSSTSFLTIEDYFFNFCDNKQKTISRLMVKSAISVYKSINLQKVYVPTDLTEQDPRTV